MVLELIYLHLVNVLVCKDYFHDFELVFDVKEKEEQEVSKVLHFFVEGNVMDL